MESTLTQEILKLSLAERIQLVEDLWDSIASTPDQLSVTDAQKAELDRRRQRFEQGVTSTRSWEEVKKNLRRE
ncbi:MAG: addiction module protein [Blastocatellales bacterium]